MSGSGSPPAGQSCGGTVEAPSAPLPLPLPRPPPAARTAPNPHCQAAAMQAQGALLSNGYMPGYQAGPPQPTWEWAQQPVQPELPPISQMLIREADAWRALLSLHGSLLHLSTDIARSSVSDAQTAFAEDLQEAFDQREASYIAGITHLSGQCDALVAEAIKIRGLRKAQAGLRAHGLRDVLHQHANEALAVGETQARNSAMTIATATSEVRQAVQTLRTQLQQSRALLQAAGELQALGPLPASAVVVMGYQQGDCVEVEPVATVLQRVYSRGALSDETLSAALWEGEAPSAEPAQHRTFQRRAGDRELQQALVARSSAERAGSAALTGH